MKILCENKFGHGAVKTFRSELDKVKRPIASSSIPFDWNIGYDIEQVMGSILPVKNQGTSGSCGGQMASSYEAVNEYFRTKVLTEKSARYIYSHIWYSGGGTDSRRVTDFLINQGVCKENLCSSYDNGNPPDEAFMERTSNISSAAILDAKTTLDTTYVSIKRDIDSIACGLRDNKGVMIALNGENNGTWLSAFPKPPVSTEWRHFLYVGKAKMINGKKYIGVLNSWGDIGEKGWQWLGEEYFMGHVWDAFAVLDNRNSQTVVEQKISLIQQLLILYKQLLQMVS